MEEKNIKSMKMVTVIPLKKGRESGELTYFTTKEINPGDIATVPLRKKKILGLVLDVEGLREAKSNIKEMSFNLKRILEVKTGTVWKKEYLETLLQLSEYFTTTKNNILTSMTPAIFREEYDKIAKFKRKIAKAEQKKIVKPEKLLFQANKEDRISAYKTLIRESFAQKKSVFIVLPTERDIKDMHQMLSKGIKQFTFTLFGGQSKKKTLVALEQIMSTEHEVLILGTAPYLATSRDDIGVIILEKENSDSYRTILKPHFDMRILVEFFASKIGAKFLLCDTLLRFETIGRHETDDLSTLHTLSYRVDFEDKIKILEKTSAEKKKKNVFRVIEELVVEEIKEIVGKEKNVFIFSLRKGLATTTLCRDCGETLTCKTCKASLVLYHSEKNEKRMFVCNRCEIESPADTVCESCGSWNLIPIGIGTDTVVEEVKKYFPKNKIFKLDRESAKTRTSAEKIMKEFASTKGGILVGTEMALFYLEGSVPLSVIASFDSLWSIPNYKMGEKVIKLMISIASHTKDKFIIQTKNRHDPAIQAVQSGNLLPYVREEIEDRRRLHYPPFVRFIKITFLGDRERALEARKILGKIFEEYNPEVFSGFIGKQKSKYVTNALIKIAPNKWSLPEISPNGKIDRNLLKKLQSLPRDFEVFVDPEDLL